MAAALMERPPPELSLTELVARVRLLARGRDRVVLGITGAPGAGKSTVCEALVQALGDEAVLVPMDGFHLSQQVLEGLGRTDRKGAPDTFDAASYAALLRRIRDRTDEVVYAPAFRRDLEEPIAGSVAVQRDTPIVVTEGNYLLLDDAAWGGVASLLDEIWFVAPDDEARVERLVARHVAFGRSAEEAREWVLRSDEANAVLVGAGRQRADLVFRAGAGLGVRAPR